MASVMVVMIVTITRIVNVAGKGYCPDGVAFDAMVSEAGGLEHGEPVGRVANEA